MLLSPPSTSLSSSLSCFRLIPVQAQGLSDRRVCAKLLLISAGPTLTDSGVLQPAGHGLAELNQRSASVGWWDVGIFKLDIERWTDVAPE